MRCWSGRDRGASGDLSPGEAQEHQFPLGHVTRSCAEVEVEFGCPGLELIACRRLPALTQGEQRALVYQLQRLGKSCAGSAACPPAPLALRRALTGELMLSRQS